MPEYFFVGNSIPWLQDPWPNDSDATKEWLRIRDSAYMTKGWLCDSWLRLHDFLISFVWRYYSL